MTGGRLAAMAIETKGSFGGGLVSAVKAGSIAAELGLRPGDRLYSIDGVVPEDYIDYRYLTAEDRLELRFLRPDGRELVCSVEKDPDEDLGLSFASDIFGPPGVRACENHCLFCFVDRLPAGLRPALYVKDDDYRLSFLHGNFITLTGLREADFERIERLRLSPLYVSVHTTDPGLRSQLMRNAHAGAIMDQLRRLVDAGISLHAQIVACPALNDGERLDQTVGDLVSLGSGLTSVGVVPVGLAGGHGENGVIRLLSPEEADDLLGRVLTWHLRLGGVVYPADELFMLTGRPIPSSAFYGEFPQLQNGIGLARRFLDDLERLRRRYAGDSDPVSLRPAPVSPFFAVTGSLARPLVEEALAVIGPAVSMGGEAIEVRNDLLGPAVTVSGLLAGRDILRAIRRRGVPEGCPVLIPGAALRAGTPELLDGVTLEQLRGETGALLVDAGWLPSHMVAALKASAGKMKRRLGR